MYLTNLGLTAKKKGSLKLNTSVGNSLYFSKKEPAGMLSFDHGFKKK